MEINQQRIEDAIIAEVSSKMISDDDLYSRIKTAVEQRIDRHFKDKADAQITSTIEDAIRNGFDREYQRVNAWGEGEGSKTTIRKELEKLIGGYWNASVDQQGKPTTSNYGTVVTRAEWIMSKIVADDFSAQMKQHVVNIGGSLKDQLRGELHQTVNKLLSEVFYVKTKDDEKARGISSIHPTAL